MSCVGAYPERRVVTIRSRQQPNGHGAHSLVPVGALQCKRHGLPVQTLCRMQIELMASHHPRCSGTGYTVAVTVTNTSDQQTSGRGGVETWLAAGCNASQVG